jgi:hypothetical protein
VVTDRDRSVVGVGRRRRRGQRAGRHGEVPAWQDRWLPAVGGARRAGVLTRIASCTGSRRSTCIDEGADVGRLSQLELRVSAYRRPGSERCARGCVSAHLAWHERQGGQTRAGRSRAEVSGRTPMAGGGPQRRELVLFPLGARWRCPWRPGVDLSASAPGVRGDLPRVRCCRRVSEVRDYRVGTGGPCGLPRRFDHPPRVRRDSRPLTRGRS